MLSRIVIVARQRDAVFTGNIGKVFKLLKGKLGRRLLSSDDLCRFLVTQLMVAAHALAPDLDIAILALAGGVIHERKLVHLARAQMSFDLLDQIDVIDLETQMQTMANQVRIAPLGALAAGDKRHNLLGVLPAPDRLGVHDVLRICRKRVIHGGDAVSDELALGLEQRRREVHEHRRARRDDCLDIVGMDIYKTGRDIATVRIDNTGAHGSRIEFALALNRGDLVAFDHKLVAKEQAVGLNNDSVANDVHRRAS